MHFSNLRAWIIYLKKTSILLNWWYSNTLAPLRMLFLKHKSIIVLDFRPLCTYMYICHNFWSQNRGNLTKSTINWVTGFWACYLDCCFYGTSLLCLDINCSIALWLWFFQLIQFQAYSYKFLTSCAQLHIRCKQALWTSSGRTFLFLRSSSIHVRELVRRTYLRGHCCKFTFIWLFWASIEHSIRMFFNNCT